MAGVLILRQKEEAFPLARIFKEKGIVPYIFPLFKPLFFSPPTFTNVQALIITSKNALRSLQQHQEFHHFPLYVVGDETANFAKDLGFTNVFSASGNNKNLYNLIKEKASCSRGILWYLSGEIIKENLIHSLKSAGFDVRRHLSYKLQFRDSLPSFLTNAFSKKKITHVLFSSSYTAEVFINLLEKYYLEEVAQEITPLCISQDVVKIASRISWKNIWVSEKPTINSILDYYYE